MSRCRRTGTRRPARRPPCAAPPRRAAMRPAVPRPPRCGPGTVRPARPACAHARPSTGAAPAPGDVRRPLQRQRPRPGAARGPASACSSADGCCAAPGCSPAAAAGSVHRDRCRCRTPGAATTPSVPSRAPACRRPSRNTGAFCRRGREPATGNAAGDPTARWRTCRCSAAACLPRPTAGSPPAALRYRSGRGRCAPAAPAVHAGRRSCRPRRCTPSRSGRRPRPSAGGPAGTGRGCSAGDAPARCRPRHRPSCRHHPARGGAAPGPWPGPASAVPRPTPAAPATTFPPIHTCIRVPAPGRGRRQSPHCRLEARTLLPPPAACRCRRHRPGAAAGDPSRPRPAP